MTVGVLPFDEAIEIAREVWAPGFAEPLET
jgi:hypothetical protein